MELTLQDKIAIGNYAKAYQKNPTLIQFAQEASDKFAAEIGKAPRTNRDANVQVDLFFKFFEAEESPKGFEGYNTVTCKDATLSFYDRNLKPVEDKLQARALINALATLALNFTKESFGEDGGDFSYFFTTAFAERNDKLIIRVRYCGYNGAYEPPVDLLDEEEQTQA